MATVKGDVHDIGKNIVGVVLQCNNYEVIDLGVMVPAQKILETAKAENVDVIGLSGLITPSLDEMVNVARDLEREGYELPLLIGGATTSKVHTAVKINPNYVRGQTVYVPDASRAVGVVSQLLSDGQRDGYKQDVRADYEAMAARHANQQEAKRRLPIAAARANRKSLDWAEYKAPKPSFLGLKTFEEFDLAKLVDRIDWTPFFQSWELHGRYPQILQDNKVGEAARTLFADAEAMLARIVNEKMVTAKAVVGFWPAGQVNDDDVALFTDEGRGEEVARFHFLRQQMMRDGGKANACLADLVAPLDSGCSDYLGGFVVTAGLGEEAQSEIFKKANDDYSAILFKALTDRLAEAFAERMHEMVRKELWGYAADETLSNDALIAEEYRGIRPAPGYPACPDHTEKRILFKLMDAEERIGVQLTESCAMWPASSVSGFYFAHPDAAYFGVGKINRDQVEDYAARKGMTVEEVERWLAPSLGYDPAAQAAA